VATSDEALLRSADLMIATTIRVLTSLRQGIEAFDAEIKAVYAGAHASEAKDPAEREVAWKLLSERHPSLGDFGPPDASKTALMRADCKYISLLDYSQGIGHTEALVIDGEL